jgi:hypothetical protein
LVLLQLFGQGGLIGLALAGLAILIVRAFRPVTVVRTVQYTQFKRVALPAQCPPLRFVRAEQVAQPAQPPGPDRSGIVAALRSLGCNRADANALAATIPADITDEAECIEYVMRRRA